MNTTDPTLSTGEDQFKKLREDIAVLGAHESSTPFAVAIQFDELRRLLATLDEARRERDAERTRFVLLDALLQYVRAERDALLARINEPGKDTDR